MGNLEIVIICRKEARRQLWCQFNRYTTLYLIGLPFTSYHCFYFPAERSLIILTLWIPSYNREVTFCWQPCFCQRMKEWSPLNQRVSNSHKKILDHCWPVWFVWKFAFSLSQIFVSVLLWGCLERSLVYLVFGVRCWGCSVLHERYQFHADYMYLLLKLVGNQNCALFLLMLREMVLVSEN